jgi:hypothetical protein
MAQVDISRIREVPDHDKIRIQFTVGQRRFEAVGFLRDNEVRLDVETMLERIAVENGGVIGNDDANYIWTWRTQLPAKLRRYGLVYGKPRGRRGDRGVPIFRWVTVNPTDKVSFALAKEGGLDRVLPSGWSKGKENMVGGCYDSTLVLRRLP